MADRVWVSGRIARLLKVMLLFAGGMLLAGAASGTTYNFTASPNYSIFNNFTGPCTSVIDCANYTSAMHPTGTFTTAAPLAPNLVNVDIAALVTSYSFNDGINTYTNANGWIISFSIYTDASGVPTSSVALQVDAWITGSAPHATGDRFSDFQLDGEVGVTNDLACSTVGTTGTNTDTCTSGSGDQNTSSASNSDFGVWVIAGSPPPKQQSGPVPVPTLSTWSLAALATLVVLLGWFQVRRRR